MSLKPIITFAEHWPRNFCVAFWCEILLAQPIARFVMKQIHKTKKDNAELEEIKKSTEINQENTESI